MTRQSRPSMRSIKIGASLALGLVLLSGCATSKDELLPHGNVSMQQLWEQGSSSGGSAIGSAGKQSVAEAREQLRRPIGDRQMIDERTHYTRDAANEIHSQFSRLPNPDLVMFIYPHLAGDEQVPIPGYSTLFPFYSQPQYAMPGEGARPPGRTR